MTNSTTFWQNYWNAKTCGEHRSQEEDFLAKEAKEKLFHLNGGNTLLDFACGSADLFAYYCREYQSSIGVDFSEQMLAKAQERLAMFGGHAALIHADDSTVWKRLENHLGQDYQFDRITAGQVIQYLDGTQIEQFVAKGITHLTEGGLICLFDVVDCRTYELWKAGLFNSKRLNTSVLFAVLIERLRGVKNSLKGRPFSDIDYTYSPNFFERLANKYNLQINIAYSMYYEYRYHVVLKPKKGA